MLALEPSPAAGFPNGRHIAAFAARGTGPRPAEDAATVGFETFGLPLVVSHPAKTWSEATWLD